METIDNVVSISFQGGKYLDSISGTAEYEVVDGEVSISSRYATINLLSDGAVTISGTWGGQQEY